MDYCEISDIICRVTIGHIWLVLSPLYGYEIGFDNIHHTWIFAPCQVVADYSAVIEWSLFLQILLVLIDEKQKKKKNQLRANVIYTIRND